TRVVRSASHHRQGGRRGPSRGGMGGRKQQANRRQIRRVDGTGQRLYPCAAVRVARRRNRDRLLYRSHHPLGALKYSPKTRVEQKKGPGSAILAFFFAQP